MDRRLFLHRLGSLAALPLVGCAAPAPYVPPPPPVVDSYTETVRSVLITTDGTKAVFLGPTNHYVFDLREQLSRSITRPELHPYLVAEFGTFMLRPNEHVEGVLTLKLRGDAPVTASQLASYLGYRHQGNGSMTYRWLLEGQRFDASGFVPPADLVPLNQAYTVEVRQLADTSKQAPASHPTPISSNGGAGLAIFLAAPILLITFPLLLLGCSTSEHACD